MIRFDGRAIFAALLVMTAVPGEAVAQLAPGETAQLSATLEGSPLTAWGESRRAGVGGRIAIAIESRLRIVGEGLIFFPDLDFAEANAAQSTRSSQSSANVFFDLNGEGPVRVYLGLGMGYNRLRVDLTVDGRTEGGVFDRWSTNRIAGIRVPLEFGAPFVEFNSQNRAGKPWTVTGGVSFTLAGGG